MGRGIGILDIFTCRFLALSVMQFDVDAVTAQTWHRTGGPPNDQDERLLDEAA